MDNQLTDEQNIKFSIIIPAYNEEKYLSKCLQSIVAASKPYKNRVEVIVILNRCSDKTEEIALSFNCITVKEDAKNLSQIRNAGAKIARGEILITIDADSWMANNMLTEIEKHLLTGKYIGGGVLIQMERASLGIIASALALMIPLFLKYGVISGGLFWCYKKDFDVINGFNEDLRIAEDVDFAIRLKRRGKQCGKTFKTIMRPRLMTSCRRFDTLGDWFYIKNPRIFLDYLDLNRQRHADELYYNSKR